MQVRFQNEMEIADFSEKIPTQVANYMIAFMGSITVMIHQMMKRNRRWS